MKIAICDDDKFFAKEISTNVQASFVDKKDPVRFDVFTDSGKLYSIENSYDMAFLDIEMEPYNGIEVAEKLKSVNPHIIIFFITSHEKYLDDAMDLNAFRYIKKPLDVVRLQAGVQKAISHIDKSNISFYIKNGRETKTVLSEDIIYIEISGHNTRVITADNEYISDCSISEWAEKLISPSFFSVHKSYIINMRYITEYKRDSVTLCKKYHIPVAYKKQTEFRSFFFDYFGG